MGAARAYLSENVDPLRLAKRYEPMDKADLARAMRKVGVRGRGRRGEGGRGRGREGFN